MKERRISDMLDQYRGDLPELNLDTPLSSRRIKELTMSRITKHEKKGKRIVFRLLVAAAIIASLSITVLAAEDVFDVSGWFREVLNLQLREDTRLRPMDSIQETVGDSQLEVINSLSQGFQPQTQEDQGTTVTLQAAYGADYLLHLIFHVEAPEGTVLPDDIVYDFVDGNAPMEERDNLVPGEDAPYKHISRQIDLEALPDEDPTDNRKAFLVTIHGQTGTACKFNDGYTKYFKIGGIYQQVADVYGDEDGYELLAPGKFVFDVGLEGELDWIHLENAEGYTYGGYKTRTWTHDSPCLPPCEELLTGETDPETGLPVHAESYTYEVEVEQLRISSMGVEWKVKYSCDDRKMAFGLAFRVVMKDGTRPVTTAANGAGGDGVHEQGTSYFTVPIDLAEVDYIIIGDEELDEIMILELPE